MKNLLLMLRLICMGLAFNIVCASDTEEEEEEYFSPVVRAHIRISRAMGKSMTPLPCREIDDEDPLRINIVLGILQSGEGSDSYEGVCVCAITSFPSFSETQNKLKLKIKKRRKKKGWVY